MREDDWDRLLYRIKQGDCTPFLGAGASAGHVKVASALAEEYATDHGYPFPDSDDLARVTQYVAVKQRERSFVKEQFLNQYVTSASKPDFTQSDQPHAVLADLPLSVYLTTNYDNFMVEALQHRGKTPVLAICPWYAKGRLDRRRATRKLFGQPQGYDPPATSPIVYHLHGHRTDAESLVLTEDDYLDFLVQIASDRNGDLLPPVVERAIRGHSLLFIGYSLSDWTFRVLFRGLLAAIPPGQQLRHVSVQLPPRLRDASDDDARAVIQNDVKSYLGDYFDEMKIDIFWGDAREFCATLRAKWEAYRAR